MGQFTWVGLRAEPSERWDLRKLGWQLRDDTSGLHPILSDGVVIPTRRMLHRTIAVGVSDAAQRAQLIGSGMADAFSDTISLEELKVRVSRTVINYARMPRLWRVDPLVLDLMHRDARVGDRWLGLRPREFKLLWHLAEAGGRAVSRAELLKHVWRINHDPGTNSVEVHVSRLRARLSHFDAEDMIETNSEGGYVLQQRPASSNSRNAFHDEPTYVMDAV